MRALLPWLEGYSAARLRGDVYGGLTAAVVALPLALAFGVASGAGAIAGMWGAIVVGFFAALFGGTPAQVSGPTGPMTVVMATVVLHYAERPELAFTVVMLGGVFQILFGVFRFGRYIKLVPQPVVSGFMSGIGLIIIILQIAPFLGEPSPAGGTLGMLHALPDLLAGTQWHALILAALALAIVVLLPERINRVLPAPLLALGLGTLLGVTVLADAPVIGDIPTGLPHPQPPAFDLHEFANMVRFGVVLAFLGSIDSLLTSLVADAVTRTHHDSDRELIGQGIGNTLAGVIGGIPGAGATMRTVVNVRAGGRTPVSGALHALVLLAVVLGAGRYAAHIPLAVLAGILMKVGIDIIDWGYLRRVHRAPRAGVVIMLTTMALTVLVDLITAVAVGVVMASLLFVKRMAEQQAASMRLIDSGFDAAHLTPEEAALLDAAAGRIVLFHSEGPVSFGSARDLARMLTARNDHEVLVVDLSAVPFVDSSASFALEDVVRQTVEQGSAVVLCGLGERVRETLRRVGVLDLVPAARVCATRQEALALARSLLAG